MEARIFEETDYPILMEWWEGHGWPGIHCSMIPKLTVIMSNEERDICAGSVYMDNSVAEDKVKICMLEWIVTNPKATNMESYKGIREMTDLLEKRVREMGYGVILTTCKQESLAKVHEKSGFIRTDSNMIHLIKILREEEN